MVRLPGSLRGCLALAIAMISLAPQAFATTQVTAPLAVTATVLSVCGVAATPLVFGNYSATTTSPTDAQATITSLCTSGVAYTISLDAGGGTGATVASRYMMSGGNALNYLLYKDSGRTTLWGDGTHSTATVSATSGIIPDIYTLYGRIPAAQQPPSGAYVDAVTVTLTY